MDVSKIGLAKMAISYVVGTSVGYTAKQMIVNNIQPETGAEIAKAFVGSRVIATMAAASATAYVDRTIDDSVKSWIEIKAKRDAEKNAPAE